MMVWVGAVSTALDTLNSVRRQWCGKLRHPVLDWFHATLRHRLDSIRTARRPVRPNATSPARCVSKGFTLLSVVSFRSVFAWSLRNQSAAGLLERLAATGTRRAAFLDGRPTGRAERAGRTLAESSVSQTNEQ